MKKLNKYIALIAVLVVPYLVQGQNDAHYSHYLIEPYIFNPAHVSNQNKIDITALGRMQWYGFPTSPANQLVCGHAWVDKLHGGIGVILINDKLGFENTFNFKGSYNYFLNVNNDNVISMGLGLGFISKTIDGSQLRYEDNTDAYAILAKDNHFAGDASFGAEWNSSDKNFVTGLAITHLNKVLHIGGKKRKELSLDNASQFYLYGTYMYQATDDIDILPSLIIKSSVFITQFDLNCIASFDRKLWWTGMTYRLSDALVVMGGYNFTQKQGRKSTIYTLGYAYEFGVGRIRTFNNGSHEIMLRVSLDGFNSTRVPPAGPRKLFVN